MPLTILLSLTLAQGMYWEHQQVLLAMGIPQPVIEVFAQERLVGASWASGSDYNAIPLGRVITLQFEGDLSRVKSNLQKRLSRSRGWTTSKLASLGGYTTWESQSTWLSELRPSTESNRLIADLPTKSASSSDSPNSSRFSFSFVIKKPPLRTSPSGITPLRS